MTDSECVAFLQWALPRLHLRWPGFRKVRALPRKRLNRRLAELGLPDLAAYRHHLEADPGEWAVLDGLCRIPISRFGRDRDVFAHLRRETLPAVARRAADRRDPELRCWSAGCASGEEPYTLRILWDLELGPRFRRLPIRIVATDIDEEILERARRACYPASSLKDLPPEWVARAFLRSDGEYCLGEAFRRGVEFRRQDLRVQAPEGSFHLVFCRNLAFTYFDDAGQREVLRRIALRLIPGGSLVIGKHEVLPEGVPGFAGCPSRLGIYRCEAPGNAFANTASQ